MQKPHDQPRPASTTLLCKITTDWPYKILFVKRSKAARFLPGAHVFPGGSLDSQDLHFARFLAHDQPNLMRLKNYFATDLLTIAHFLACAIRETLEEVGLSILQAQDVHGSTPIASSLLKNLLQNPHQDAPRPCLDNIWGLSWWITPEGEIRRYNTWFFLALVNDITCKDQIELKNDETSQASWLYPNEAIKLYEQKEIFLAPPTRSIVERMASCESFDEFLSYIDQPLWPIEPFFIDDTDKTWLILPGDKKHHQAKPSSLPLKTRYSFP